MLNQLVVSPRHGSRLTHPPKPTGGICDIRQDYPAGRRLRRQEKHSEKQNAPRNHEGAALRWDYNVHAGGKFAKSNCTKGVHGRAKNAGAHWAALSQLARRGGVIGSPILRVEYIDCCAQSLRGNPSGEKVRKMNESDPSQTGGY